VPLRLVRRAPLNQERPTISLWRPMGRTAQGRFVTKASAWGLSFIKDGFPGRRILCLIDTGHTMWSWDKNARGAKASFLMGRRLQAVGKELGGSRAAKLEMPHSNWPRVHILLWPAGKIPRRWAIGPPGTPQSRGRGADWRKAPALTHKPPPF